MQGTLAPWGVKSRKRAHSWSGHKSWLAQPWEQPPITCEVSLVFWHNRSKKRKMNNWQHSDDYQVSVERSGFSVTSNYAKTWSQHDKPFPCDRFSTWQAFFAYLQGRFISTLAIWNTPYNPTFISYIYFPVSQVSDDCALSCTPFSRSFSRTCVRCEKIYSHRKLTWTPQLMSRDCLHCYYIKTCEYSNRFFNESSPLLNCASWLDSSSLWHMVEHN